MTQDLKHTIVSVNDHIARVELNRPPVNALNREFVEELTMIARRLADDSAVWLVVVSSRQKVFSAGADLKERAGIPDPEVAQIVRGIQGLAGSWGEIPQVVVMGIQGAALGGGLEFALAADLLAASHDARLGLPEVSLGILPAAGGTQRLAHRASLGVARKWVLSAAQFSAAEALRDGVIDYVFDADSFADQFAALVSRLSANAPLSLRQAKKALTHLSARALAEGFAAELEAYTPLISTEDRREALKAFAEKRLPNWKGK
jgi:enoyl-CoA hydratase/carnithine racemase